MDIVIPDFTYLVENRELIRGVFITHAHEDHVGALPYLLQRVRVPVYATEFAKAMILGKLEETLGKGVADVRTYSPGNMVEAGSLRVEPIRVTHSIPESCSVAVHTSHGVVLVTGDFKLDFSPVDGKMSDLGRFADLGALGVVCLLSDSTNVERPGWGPSEREVLPGLRQHLAEAPGRVMLTTFASSIYRLQQVIDAAFATGRKVAVAGRRMETTMELASRLGYIRAPDGVRIRLEDVGKYQPHEVVILTTGSQGEPMSALVQMSKEEYGRLKIAEGDTILYSARPIPGNEAAIWRTVNRLFRIGARVIYESDPPIHVSGHAYREELRMMINLTKPYYLAPVHGEPRHQHKFLEIGKEMGYPDHRMFELKDGETLCIEETSAYIGESVPCGRVLVDNSGRPGITDEILRDRSNLANDGLIVVTVLVDPEAGEIVGDPVLQAKGFSGDSDVLDKAAVVVTDALLEMSAADLRDSDVVRHAVSDVTRRYIHKRSQLRPVVVPTVLEV